MVDGLELPPGSRVLDVAAGTGSITRLLRERDLDVVALDQSPEMLHRAHRSRVSAVLATAERLPFEGGTFDGVTFGYLLRYVDSISGCLRELARVLRPGGSMGMVEFGRPTGPWGPPWWLYTRVGLPLAGAIIGSGWWRVGRFLGPSIDSFAGEHPPERLREEWRAAGLRNVRIRHMSLGGGLVVWGRRA